MLWAWVPLTLASSAHAIPKLPSFSLGPSSRPVTARAPQPDLQLLNDMTGAVDVMQDAYFQPWLGTWPAAIDWTAAVMGSHLSGATRSLAQGLDLVPLGEGEDYRHKENVISQYFSQVIGAYLSQNTIAMRGEAFDDILWVVLGWLDTIQLVDLHSALHYNTTSPSAQDVPTTLRNLTWYGNRWTSAFAHRSRIFWDLASAGWDDKLCGGGMTWNPRLEPYKNAITNELFIAASVSMYLYFPGDTNSCPFTSVDEVRTSGPCPADAPNAKPHNPMYLNAAVEGYAWLMASGMRNAQGLFTDGFHISGYKDGSSNNTKCDVRNEMVYTYNQGVVLTGQVGLARATGNASYLDDGHTLIKNVINATGYDLAKNAPVDDLSKLPRGELPPAHGLGRAGVLEDTCDKTGECSQDSHTFKGIFFHHLVAFCAPPDPDDVARVSRDHASRCKSYLGWVAHNAGAALLSRDSTGKFGMWWTAGLLNLTGTVTSPTPRGRRASEEDDEDGNRAVDYRNHGVPNTPLWVPAGASPPPPPVSLDNAFSAVDARSLLGASASALGGGVLDAAPFKSQQARQASSPASDPNNRGRGRTVETQGGGVAVLRAFWEISRLE